MENLVGERSFLAELFRSDWYKRSQGKLVRRVTLAALIVIVAIGAFQMFSYWSSFPGFITGLFPGEVFRYVMPLLFLAAGAWVSFRAIHFARFADFLIAVEAEINKVSWPTRTELIRGSMVVIVVIGLLAILLFAFDLVLRVVLGEWLKIISA